MRLQRLIRTLPTCVLLMKSGDLSSEPRYSFVALRSRWLRLPNSRKLDFHDEGILIYKYVPKFRHDSEYVLLRRAEYTDITKCRYSPPKVTSSSTLGGFAWANKPAQIRLSILKHRSTTPRVGNEHFWNAEHFLFGSPHMKEDEFKIMYSWLCDKVMAKGGNI